MHSDQAQPLSAEGPEEPAAPGPSEEFRWSWYARAAFLFTGVVLPAICLARGYPDPPTWRSGGLSGYAALLLTHGPLVPFCPFLLYNMTCMTLMVVRPERFSKHLAVRCGIYSGVIVAIHHWVLFSLALFCVGNPVRALLIAAFFGAAAVFIPSVIAWVLCRWVSVFSRVHPAAVPTVFVFLLAAAALNFHVIVFLALFCSTPWAVASYGLMSCFTATRFGSGRIRFTMAQLFAAVTWLAAYLAAWRTAVLLMLGKYAELPTTTPDDCYVCTAAARGHAPVVGSERFPAPGSETCCVNDQMRYLKAAELALAALAPGVHRLLRRAYDRIGPALAGVLVHPLLADAAYVSLKPAEWLARLALALLLPGQENLVRGMYRRGGEGSFESGRARLLPSREALENTRLSRSFALPD